VSFQVAYSRTGEWLASSGDDNTIAIQEATGGEAWLRLTLPRVEGIAFDRDGTLLAGCGAQGSRLWSLPKGKVLADLPPSRRIAFAPDGKTLALGLSRQVQLWDVQNPDNPRLVKTLDAHRAEVNDLALSTDGTLLATAGSDWLVRLWDSKSGQLRFTFRQHAESVKVVRFAPDGTLIASGGHDHRALVWKLDGTVLARVPHPRQHVGALDFTPDSKSLVSAAPDGLILIHEARTGKSIRRLVGHYGGVTGVACWPRGGRIASSSWDGSVRLWDINLGDEPPVLRPHRGTVRAVDFSRDGQFATAGSDSCIVVHDSRTLKRQRALLGHTATVRSVVFFPDG
jgi:WD40 repeat protein